MTIQYRNTDLEARLAARGENPNHMAQRVTDRYFHLMQHAKNPLTPNEMRVVYDATDAWPFRGLAPDLLLDGLAFVVQTESAKRSLSEKYGVNEAHIFETLATADALTKLKIIDLAEQYARSRGVAEPDQRLEDYKAFLSEIAAKEEEYQRTKAAQENQ